MRMEDCSITKILSDVETINVKLDRLEWTRPVSFASEWYVYIVCEIELGLGLQKK